ncbi:hypothetical protein CTAYLR_009988 [Chrysophaeum taylorii]|uniref:RanBD1 domain-containing protein n=1 Tax=Chrysophaeum taylorii TaxID=2483200 RepID=A0AAD7UK37_9STRA|nr:hypothetical protein CTAYLR_009988 [Chrysophaeum taylorii]
MFASSSKRRSENSQIRREDYDAEKESSEAGTFLRASADVMRSRKIVSVSDKFGSSRFGDAKPDKPLFGGAPPPNPFASIQLKPAEGGRSIFGDRKPDSASEKLKRCNRAFADWIRKQQSKALSVPWTEGVRDYLRYVEPLIKQAQADRPAPKKAPPLLFPQPQQEQPAAAGDDDAMPREKPSEVIRADDGDEIQVAEARAAIRRLDRDDDAGPTWRDLGKGLLRVMEHKETKARRVVVRNDVGKVVLNFAIADHMKFFQNKAKASLKFTAVTDNGAQNLLLRTKPLLKPEVLKPATVIDQ